MDRPPFDPEKIRGPDGPDGEVEALAHRVIGAAIEVHKHLGPGFLENVYEEALCHELDLQGMKYRRQPEFVIEYKGKNVGRGRTDLIVEEKLLLELKAVEKFATLFTSQTVSYLKATGIKLALLINFNVPRLADGIRRVVF